MTTFPVAAIRSVELAVADVSAAVAFYRDTWGLCVADRGSGTAYLRGTGTDPYILSLTEGSASAIRSITFRAEADADLGVIVRNLSKAGAQVLHEAATTDELGGGTMISVRDPRGRTIRVVQGDALVDPIADDGDRPERLAHVNYNSVDPDADTRFLADGLGFRLTDRSEAMAFVRTNSNHNAVVIAQANVNTLNHIAFLLPSWENVMRASGRMIDAGFPIGWGPGRHGPGDNVFVYFVDQCGFVMEYTAEILQVDDDYRIGRPGDWTWPAGRVDHWGICPPKMPACKAAQLQIPFL